jgi:signal transduction histidine kinase
MSVATQLLTRRLEKQREVLDDRVFTSVHSLHSEITRLDQLLKDFRALSRRQQFTRSRVNLTALVRELLAGEGPYYSAHGIRIQSLLPATQLFVHADTDKLKQVLVNLCKNAVEAMPAGGTLSVALRNGDAHVSLEIADTGVGIPTGVDIFEPFVTTKADGTGLGLAIVREIVEAHKGKLTYTSTPGQGTTFSVTLPCGPSEEPGETI